MKKQLWLIVGLLAVWAPLDRIQAQIISPKEFLGFAVGEDRQLADWQQIAGYFRRLGNSSDRVKVETVGRTTEGNPFLVAIISSPSTLGRLEHYREIQAQLADPRRVSGDPSALFEEGKTVVMITCAIHSTEVASAQMSMEFAWELASGRDSETASILDNVIFLLVPSLNPDGINIVNHWYQQTLGTPAEGTSPPRLYQKYVGHDNNRDWYMFTQQETRLAVERLHNRWHPQIVYDVHQMGPYGARMFVPPFIDPVEPNVDPILQAEIVDLGGRLFSDLIAGGKKGIVTNAIYDAFTPARAYQHYHAGVRILSESASVRLGTPIQIEPEQLRPGRNYDARRASGNFPDPWPGGEWHLRDIIENQKITLKACLLHAARYRRRWLRNFYQIGLNALGRQSPYAFVLPPAPEQRDPAALYELAGVLQTAMVEIERASQPFQVAAARRVSAPLGSETRTRFPAGSFIVRLRQPYGAFAKTMLEIQHYPRLLQYPGGPLKRPYDVTAHTLGIQMGVEAYQVEDPFVVGLESQPALAKPSLQSTGEGEYWLFGHTSNSFALLVNRLLQAEFSVFWAPNGFEAGGRGYPAGTLMAHRGSQAFPRQAAEGLPLRIRKVSRWPELAWQRIHRPRIGLYQSYAPSMDEGWTRWILEQYEFSYRTLHDADIRRGDLSEYDLILFADQSPKSILEGLADPYPEKFRGGIGPEGLQRLKAFAADGGTLLFLGAATALPINNWKIGVKNPLQELAAEDFYVPGALLRVEVNNRHPIGYGMPPQAAVMFLRSPAFQLEHGLSIASYTEPPFLLSGWANGQQQLAGRTALAEVPLGQGRLILIGFRTQFRAQARGGYKFLFNSFYYSTTGG